MEEKQLRQDAATGRSTIEERATQRCVSFFLLLLLMHLLRHHHVCLSVIAHIVMCAWVLSMDVIILRNGTESRQRQTSDTDARKGKHGHRECVCLPFCLFVCLFVCV